MASKFRGVKWNNARFPSTIKIRRSIDLAELGDFGSITENSSDLPTAGATHRKSTGGSTSATRGHTDLQSLFDAVVDNQDMGSIGDATTTHRVWSAMGAITDIVTEAPTGILAPLVTSGALDFSSISLVNTTYGGGAQHYMGSSIDANDNYIVVGSPGPGSGSISVYDASDYSLLHTVSSGDTNNTHSQPQFGRGVNICGTNNDKVLVTSEYGHGWGNGNAHIIDLATGNVEYNLYNSGQMVKISTGYSSASNNYVTVGTDVSGVADTLQVFDVTTGNLIGVFSDPNWSSGGSNYFAKASATTSQYLVAGAPYTDVTSSKEGIVYVYDISTAQLSYTINNPNNETPKLKNSFGEKVTANEDYIVASVKGVRADGGATAYVFNIADGSLVKTIDDLPSTDTITTMYISDNILGISGHNGSGVFRIHLYDTTDFSFASTISSPETREGIANDWFGGNLGLLAITDSNKVFASSPYIPHPTSGETGNGVWYTFEIENAPAESSAPVSAPVIPMSDFSTITLQNSITNPEPSSWAMFGRTSAVNDTYAIVGAHQIDDPEYNSGKALIYNLSDGSVKYTLENPNIVGTAYHDTFGVSVDISNSYAIVGAYGEDTTAGVEGSGAAYIYDLSDGSVKYTLENPSSQPKPYHGFGWTSAISDSYAAVGATGDDTLAASAGSVYVYDVTDGSLLYTFNGTQASGNFGTGLAISGSYMIVGEAHHSRRKAYVYDLTDGSLLYTFDDPLPLTTTWGGAYGYAVAITGSHAIVSALQQNSNMGVAYIYDLSDGSLLYTLNGTDINGYFGRSVALNDSYAVVGAAGLFSDGYDQSGKAFIYDLSDGSLAYTIDNANAVDTTQGDNFGFSVAINNTHVVVGAYREKGSDGSDAAGAAYIYSGS